MTTSRDLKKWIGGALLVAAVAGCQPGEPVEDALAALPEATVLMSSEDGVPRFIVGELGKIDPAHEAGPIGGDRGLRAALPPILEALRLTGEELVLRRISADERGGRHFRYDQRLEGLDVIGGELVVHVDEKGAIAAVNGTARGDVAPGRGALEISEGAARLIVASDARWAGLAGRAV